MTTDDLASEVAKIRPNDSVGLLSLVLTQLGEVEKRILFQLAENARAAQGRWEEHEREHHKMSQALKALEERLELHLDEEREEDLVMEARLGPIRSAGALLVREWRTILIVVLVAWNMLQHAAYDLISSLVP